MIKFRLFFLSLILGFASTSNAAEFGAQHNRLLDCLHRVFPQGQASINDILKALVYNCNYKPPLVNIDDFINKYGFLGLDTLQNIQNNDLSGIIKLYNDNFTRRHIEYLRKAENILKSQKPLEAARALENLYKSALNEFCPRYPFTDSKCSNSNIAVIAAIDIGASSSRYWSSWDENNKKPKWWHIVLADVAGGIVGGIFGGGVGAVGLGSACSGAVASNK